MKIVKSELIFGGFLALSPAVFACSVCATAAADAAIPEIRIWALLSSTWMLLTGGLAWWHTAKVPGHPRLAHTVGILLVAAVLALGMLGLGLGMLLFIPPATAFVISLFGSPGRFASVSLRRHVRQLGVLAMIGVAAATLLSVHVRTTRTTGEFIVQWEGTAIGRSYLSQPPKASRTMDYRFVAEHGSEYIASDAGARLAEVGNSSDVRLLESVLERARIEQWNESSRDQLQAAVERLRKRLGE